MPILSKEKFRRCHRDSFGDAANKEYVAQDGLTLLKILKAKPDFKLPL